MQQFFTPKEVGARACLSRSLVYLLLRTGKLPALRVGARGKGKYLIREEDLEAFLSSCKLADLNPPLAGRQEAKP